MSLRLPGFPLLAPAPVISPSFRASAHEVSLLTSFGSVRTRTSTLNDHDVVGDGASMQDETRDLQLVFTISADFHSAQTASAC